MKIAKSKIVNIYLFLLIFYFFTNYIYQIQVPIIIVLGGIFILCIGFSKLRKEIPNVILRTTKRQRKGYALALLTKMLEDLKKKYPKKGYYLLVMSDNIPAIRLYQKLGFRSIREVYNTATKERTQYTVMAKGQSNIDQLMKVQFHGFSDKK